MSKFTTLLLSAALVAALTQGVDGAAECGTTWKCGYTDTAPKLDADHSDWDDIEAFTTGMHLISGVEYPEGKSSFKCSHDDTKIYLALEIPGDYRFNTTDNKLCAAVATMMKIGVDATYVNMGGCPTAPTENCTVDVIPDTCDAHRVDIGAHWELKTTEQGVEYPINVPATGETGSGNDLVANKDDEYSVSPFCRFDDNDGDAGNEWAGAWLHTNPVDGEAGIYKFELSRLLKTKSAKTDAQMTTGETYSFGVAFWDPFESEAGWTDINHYVTGCASKWIDLELTAKSAGVVASAAKCLAVIAAVTAAMMW